MTFSDIQRKKVIQMPAECRPDITSRKVLGNIEKYRIIRNVKSSSLAKAMRMSIRTYQYREQEPTTFKLTEIICAAKYLGVEVEELFK